MLDRWFMRAAGRPRWTVSTLLAAAVGVGAGIRLTVLQVLTHRGTDIHDMNCRVFNAINVRVNHVPLRYQLADIWLPLHYWMIQPGWGIGVSDPVGWARAMTWGCSLLLLLTMASVARRLFGETNALFTMLLCSVNFLQCILSVSATVEVPFQAAIYLALWCLLRYLDRRTFRALLGAALCAAASGLLRYEGWLYSAIFAGVLLVHGAGDARRRRWAGAAVFALIALAPAAVCMAASLALHGVAIHGLAVSNHESEMSFRTGIIAVSWEGLREYGRQAALPTMLVLLAGLVLAARERRHRLWYVALSIPGGLMVFKFLNGTLLGLPRYLSTSFVLLLPFALNALLDLGRRLEWKAGLTAVLMLLELWHFEAELGEYRQQEQEQLPAMASALYVRAHSDSRTRAIAQVPDSCLWGLDAGIVDARRMIGVERKTFVENYRSNGELLRLLRSGEYRYFAWDKSYPYGLSQKDQDQLARELSDRFDVRSVMDDPRSRLIEITLKPSPPS